MLPGQREARRRPCGCSACAAHLPLTNEKFLCARERISLSKWTKKAGRVPVGRQHPPYHEP